MSGNLTPLPPELRPLATELETFHRELPRLLDDGEAGRFAVLKGAQVVSTWDTYRDAIQYGYEKFGVEPFLVQPIDTRYEVELAQFFGPVPIQESA